MEEFLLSKASYRGSSEKEHIKDEIKRGKERENLKALFLFTKERRIFSVDIFFSLAFFFIPFLFFFLSNKNGFLSIEYKRSEMMVAKKRKRKRKKEKKKREYQ